MADGEVRTRADLVALLSLAAEVEHSLMCQYLFAALTLKQGTDEGLRVDQSIRVVHWEKKVLAVARQEMEHLGLVANLLTAIGSAPTLSRPAFPYATSLWGHRMELSPFSLDTVKKFACFERPQDVAVETLPCPPVPDELAAWPESVVVLYEAIRAGVMRLAAGPDPLFLVDAGKQLSGLTLGADFPRVGAMGGGYDVFLAPVTDLPSALAAIDLIITQGEAAETAGDEGHFAAFVSILKEYETELSHDPRFAPGRPVVTNPSTRQRPGTTLITDPLACEVADLFDAAYQTMLVFLLRLLMSTDENPAESSALLAVAFFPMMTMVVRPLAEILTALPAHSPDDGTRAGPPFALDGPVAFLPHRQAAWQVLTQELSGLTARAGAVAALAGAPARLGYVAETLSLVTQRFTLEITEAST